MRQMYKIYINENPLVLCTSGESTKIDLGPKDLSFFYTGNKKRLHNVIDMMEKSRDSGRIILHSGDLSSLWKDFKSVNTKNVAAGGIVLNEKGQLLVIFRKGRWDLPKGKIEKKEKKKEAAIREVEEECGVKDLTIISKSGTTWHLFRNKGKKILKKSIWYFMETKDQKLTPQKEEDIHEAKWVYPDDFLENYDMYASIRHIVKQQFSRIVEL